MASRLTLIAGACGFGVGRLGKYRPIENEAGSGCSSGRTQWERDQEKRGLGTQKQLSVAGWEIPGTRPVRVWREKGQ